MKRKSLLKNSIFLTGYKLLAILFPLLTSMYVSRILSAENVGKVAFAQNIVSYFVVLAALGIPAYGTREIAKTGEDRTKCSQVFSELFLINMVSTLVCLFAYYAIIFTVDSFRDERILYITVSLSLFLNIFNVDWFYQGKEEYVYITIRSFFVKIISLISLFLFVKDTEDYIIYALINCSAIAVNNIFNVVNLRRLVEFRIVGLKIVHHLRYILVLFSTSLAVELYTQLDTTMIGFLSGETEVAYYSYAIKLIRIVTSIITAVSTILLPRLSYCYIKQDYTKFNELCTKALKVVLSFSIPATIGLLMVADKLIPLLFGYEFVPSVSILKTLSPLIVILAIGNLLGSSILVAVGKEKYLLYTTLIGAVINLFMNSVLIPNFGANGAAIASVCSEFVVMIAQRYFSYRNVKFIIEKKFIVSLVITNICMLVCLCFINMLSIVLIFKMFIEIMVGGCVYVLIGYIMGNDTIRWLVKQIFVKLKRYIIR